MKPLTNYARLMDMLANYYFNKNYTVLEGKNMNNPQVQWLITNWTAECSNHHNQSDATINIFKKKHRLRMKLIQPPEDIL